MHIDLSELKKIAVITACSKRKLDRPAPAGELNQGQFFRGVKMFCRTHGFDLFIISAKYGLISEHEPIEPYDKKLHGKAHIRQIREISTPRMVQLLPQYHRILILAGKTYSSILSEFRGDPKFVWFFDRQGSGGFNRLITKLNTYSSAEIAHILTSDYTSFDYPLLLRLMGAH